MRWRRRPNWDEWAERFEHCRLCGAYAPGYVAACPSCGASLVEEKTANLRTLRKHGGMTRDAYDIAVRLFEDGPGDDPAFEDTGIRKQAGDLQLSDLHEFPVWEYALDEEGLQGQDEETVRPRPDLAKVDPVDGIFVVRAEFVTADGTVFEGFVSPHEEAHAGYLGATIVAPEGQVGFWFGMVRPRPDALERAYWVLGKTAPKVFPLRYRALVEATGVELTGTIDGFMYYPKGSTSEIVVLT